MFRPVLLLLALLPLPGMAQIYKCVDASGQTAYSDKACPSGSQSKLMELTPPAATLPPPAMPAGSTPVVSSSHELPELPPVGSDNAGERMRLALEWVASRYPFLDSRSPQADPQAIQSMTLLQNQSVASGMDQADALVSAARLAAIQQTTRPLATPTAPPLQTADNGSGLTVIQLGKDSPSGSSEQATPQPTVIERSTYYPVPVYTPYPPHPHRPHPPRPDDDDDKRIHGHGFQLPGERKDR